MKTKKAHMSVVIPVFNEVDNLPVLYAALVPVLEAISTDYEIIFVDDGSKDASFQCIAEICEENPQVVGLALSRNFGQQIALLAGIEHASGEVVVMMDADMQHPPSVITALYEQYCEGYDIVNTLRLDTLDASGVKKITSRWFYKLLNRLTDVQIPPAGAEFRLLSRKVVDAFVQLQERDRFTRGLVSWMGFRHTTVPYTAPPRFAGTSKYSLTKMLYFAVDGITSFSAKPLRIAFFAGVLVALLGLLYAVFAVAGYFSGHTIPGWTSILVSILLIGGLQLISLGIIGEYLARVFNEAKHRPLYFVREYASQDKETWQLRVPGHVPALRYSNETSA